MPQITILKKENMSIGRQKDTLAYTSTHNQTGLGTKWHTDRGELFKGQE